MNRYKTFVFLLALNLFIPWEVCHSRSALVRWFPGLFPKTTIDKALRTDEGRKIVNALVGVKLEPGEIALSRKEGVKIIHDLINNKPNPHLDLPPYLLGAERRILQRNGLDTDTNKVMTGLAQEIPEARENASRLAEKIRAILGEAEAKYTNEQKAALAPLMGKYNAIYIYYHDGFIFPLGKTIYPAYLTITEDTGIFSSADPNLYAEGKVFIDKSILYIKSPETILTINLRGIDYGRLHDDFMALVTLSTKGGEHFTRRMKFKKTQ